MKIQDFQTIFARHPKVKALGRFLAAKDDKRIICLQGLQASSASMIFAALPHARPEALNVPYIFVLDDMEEAGYFMHDLVQILGDEQVLFFPSSFKRAVRFDSTMRLMRFFVRKFWVV